MPSNINVNTKQGVFLITRRVASFHHTYCGTTTGSNLAKNERLYDKIVQGRLVT